VIPSSVTPATCAFTNKPACSVFMDSCSKARGASAAAGFLPSLLLFLDFFLSGSGAGT
jgi:hypothetical protein